MTGMREDLDRKLHHRQPRPPVERPFVVRVTSVHGDVAEFRASLATITALEALEDVTWTVHTTTPTHGEPGLRVLPPGITQIGPDYGGAM